MEIEQLYNQFWDLCSNFKHKTNSNTNYIEYISALLYLKYYEEQSKKFQAIYKERENYCINEKIDEAINSMRKEIGDEKIFSDIQFKNLVFYRKPGEKNILSITIEQIEQLSKNITKEEIVNAYEFAIKQSAMYGDIKGTESIFYTPKEIADIMVKMLVEKKEKAKIYDPMYSSGNFLIKASEIAKVKIFGEESNIEYYSIFQTRILLKEIEEEEVKTEVMKFDYAILNPPFSQKNWKKRIKNTKIFDEYGLSDNAVGDYAYVLSTLEKLKENGKMAVILPHGVLFRENEKNVRKTLIEKNEIKAIIGLPENLFYNTRISVIVLIIEKNRKEEDVLFIEASNEFETRKGNYILTQEHQNKMIDVYQNKKEIEGFSRVVQKEEIRKKDFNLSIKKYIRKQRKKETIEQNQLIKKIRDLENEKNILEKKIKEILNDFGDGGKNHLF